MSAPLTTTTFTLTRADALAWERRRRSPTILGALAFVIWLALGPAIAWLLPDNWAGTPNQPSFWALAAVLVAILYVLAMMRWTIGELRRARRRVRKAYDVTVEEYPDYLEIIGAGIPRRLSFAETGKPIVTPTHLFAGTGDNVVILPRRAFPEEGRFDSLVWRFNTAGVAAPPVDPAPAPA